MSGWRDDAACLEHDLEMWFPVGRVDDWRTPREICGTCPVQAECLTFAMENGEWEGIWGGLDPEERRLMHRRQTAKARKTRKRASA